MAALTLVAYEKCLELVGEVHGTTMSAVRQLVDAQHRLGVAIDEVERKLNQAGLDGFKLMEELRAVYDAIETAHDTADAVKYDVDELEDILSSQAKVDSGEESDDNTSD
jgi:hypothetical protein